MCGTTTNIPLASEADVAPIVIQPKQVSQLMWQIKCPCCEATTNFRDSSFGGITKCRNCGFRINLPSSPSAAQGNGCISVVIAAVVIALMSLGRLV
jgi:hypothetical protein